MQKELNSKLRKLEKKIGGLKLERLCCHDKAVINVVNCITLPSQGLLLPLLVQAKAICNVFRSWKIFLLSFCKDS